MVSQLYLLRVVATVLQFMNAKPIAKLSCYNATQTQSEMKRITHVVGRLTQLPQHQSWQLVDVTKLFE